MKTISIINLKGGVGKTISAINIAYVLAAEHGARVLLIDNDKQGNTSKFFNVHSYDEPSIADVLTVKGFPIERVIKHTTYSGLDVIPANMTLLRADKEILLDTSRVQQTRLMKALQAVVDAYDYCVIDNAPDLNMSVINALAASQDVLIPVKVDKFAFDGLEQIAEQIEEVRDWNAKIKIAGCFITMYQQNNVNALGETFLNKQTQFHIFRTKIRKTVKVDESTFKGKPLQIYSKNCTAAHDYVALVDEYLQGCNVTENSTKKGAV